MFKVALVGLGDISDIHIHALNALPQVSIVAVCDVDPSLFKKVEGARGYEQLEDMLKEEELDALHVLLPHYLHAPVAKLALEHHVNVFLEKPAGITLEEIYGLQEAEKKSSAKLCLCLQNRINHTTVALKDALIHEEVEGIMAEVPWYRPEEYYSSKPWRGTKALAGGGHMINQGLHTLDLMSYLLGPITWVRGQASKLLPYTMEVEDTVSARVGYKSGVIGYYTGTNASDRNHSVKITVTCKKGKYIMKDYKLSFFDEKDQEHFMGEDEKLMGGKSYYGAGHKTLIKMFYEALENNEPMPVPVGEALASARLMKNIMKSSKRNETMKMEERYE